MAALERSGGEGLKAITIRQPWAHLVITGAKDIENRDWSTEYRGPVLIHASKTWSSKEIVSCRRFMEARGLGKPPEPGAAAAGAILGVAELVDCVEDHPSPWFVGKHGFVLRSPLAFERPIKMNGALGLWTPLGLYWGAIDDAISLATYEAGRALRIAAGEETACRGCGCSESRACPESCSWVLVGWCSACQYKAEVAEMRKEIPGHGGTR